MKNNMKKTWNTPKIVQIAVSKTATGQKKGQYEVKLGDGTNHAITSMTITS